MLQQIPTDTRAFRTAGFNSTYFPTVEGFVSCRVCGYQNQFTRQQRMMSVEGIYCRGCGGVVYKDGTPMRSTPETV